MSVSIVIPCFNSAHTLRRAVVSALRQTDISEVIVVDDVSTDNSVIVANDLASNDSRVRIYSQQLNCGPGAARNRGVTESSGQFVCFLDADDELLGNFIAEALKLFRDSPELIVAKCEVEFFDPIKGYILPIDDPRHQAAILSSSCGMVLRRDYFLRSGGFPEDPIFRGPAGGEDVAFMKAVMAHFQPMARMEQPGYRVWSQTGSHLDRFLAHTRLKDGGLFEFVAPPSAQLDADKLEQAMKRYLEAVGAKISIER